ncbi:MAG: SDR family NAD(P)-dependent oxidoreductase [Terriglobia bacterium]
MDWRNRLVLVTGGSSFIGSHLVDALIERGAHIRVVDNLSSGKHDNIAQHLEGDQLEFRRGDLRDSVVAQAAMRDVEVVFHLAADHGGRGYVDLHQGTCAGNLLLDAVVFRAALKARVGKVVYASSGCVYPNYLQTDPQQVLYLKEDMVGPPYDADNTYGWAKLMGEMTLRAFYEDYGMKSACCRYFTVYGERGVENHAVIAMIARAFAGQDPFAVWGTGEQIRNWTHVSDIVRGTLLAAERIDDGIAVNLGTSERTRVIDAVRAVLRYTGHKAKIQFRPEMPTGPYNRVADNTLAREMLAWHPRISFVEGLHRTIDWYFKHKKKSEVQAQLGFMLTERHGASKRCA